MNRADMATATHNLRFLLDKLGICVKYQDAVTVWMYAGIISRKMSET